MDNISKILDYLRSFAKSNIILDDKEIECPVNSIKLGPRFFNTDGCNMCGFCCLAEHNVYTEFEWKAIKACVDDDILEYGRKYGEENGLPLDFVHALQNESKESIHNVNGKDVKLYTYSGAYPTLHLEGRGDRPRCALVHVRPDGKVVCGAHPVRSITCRMPHLRIYKSTAGNITLNLAEYGRNWALKCSICAFPEPGTSEIFEANKADRLDKLEYLLKIANDMNVETYLPTVIEHVKSATFDNYKDMLGNDLLHYKHTKKLF